MYCPSCGRETPADTQFCSACGAPLNPAARPPSSPPQPSEQPYVAPAGAATIGGSRYAGFWIRFLAMVIDGIIVAMASFFVMLPIAMVLGVAAVGAGGGRGIEEVMGGAVSAVSMLVSIGLQWVYEAGFTSSARQATPGKMALSIVVADMNGGRISFARATGRHFAKYLSSAILMIGYLIQPFTERRQALHDMLAGTLVLRR